jgi:hypothetical protein
MITPKLKTTYACRFLLKFPQIVCTSTREHQLPRAVFLQKKTRIRITDRVPVLSSLYRETAYRSP